MGIDVGFPFTPHAVRSLYLEGYGALFWLTTRLPLLPPAKPEAQKEKPAADSDWEEARREVLGQHGQGQSGAQAGEDYNEAELNKLKGELVEALKNAANIRGLKPDDSITVCVFGAAVPAAVRPVTPPGEGSGGGFGSAANLGDGSGGGFGSGAPFVRQTGPQRSTILTLSVKKFDVDAATKGKLTPQEFGKRVKISAYASGNIAEMGGFGRSSGGGGGGGGFSFGARPDY
jgi:hypothetical protein